MTTGDEPREVGPVESAIESDLSGMTLGTGKVFLAATARKLARAIDARGDEESPSSLAKAVDSLFKVMSALLAKESSDPDDLKRLAEIFGSPDTGSPAVSPALRYPKEPKPANGRPRNRQGRAGARPD